MYRRACYIFVVGLFSCALMWNCANIMAPQGGPKDTLPPRIMGAEPFFNTTNFTSKKIYIAFDEFVQIKDQQKEFFVSPMMAKQPNIYVKGRGVQIEIKDDSLKPNTTYSLNFGSSIRDNNEGNPLNGFRYVFSTGSEIDSLYASAYTADAFRGDSVSRTLLFFFPSELDSIPEYDSLMFRAKPSIISRAENNGIVIAKNLKPISYRIYAIADANNNFTYEPGVDKIGFLDGSYNPVDLPNFDAWYDTTRLYVSAQPQLYFRMFTDRQFKRQLLAKSQRTEQRKITLMFGSANPHIESLDFSGILPEDIITEYTTKGRDTINYWLKTPLELLPDTITARITYEKHDSIRQLLPQTDTLKLIWKFTETREQKKEREQRERDEDDRRKDAEKDGIEYVATPVPTKFKYSGGAPSELIPDLNIRFEFDKPLAQVDTTLFSLVRLGEEDKRFRVRYLFRQDSTAIRQWTMSATWQAGQKYELVIPQGAFTDVYGEKNDTIRQPFTVADPEKFGSMTVNVIGKTTDAQYVIQLYDATGRTMIAEKRNVTEGKSIFTYLKPGEISLRVIEDINGNGEWDAGNLVERQQPERVEKYYADDGNSVIAIKANWDMELSIDMNTLFAPIDINAIRRQLVLQENERAKRMVEERVKKQQQQQQQSRGNQGQQSQGGGFGIPGMGGGGRTGNGGLQQIPSSRR